MNSKIYLIRHGITEGNVKHWYYGWTDVPLLPEGQKKIIEYREAGKYPEIAEAAPVFTSTLKRTQETLELAFGKRNYRAIPELMEFNFGKFEAMPVEDFMEDPDFDLFRYDETGEVRFGGGDSNHTFHDRIQSGVDIVKQAHFQYCREAEEEIPASLVVCHGGVISQIVRILFPDLSEDMKWDLVPDPGMGYEIRFLNEKPVSYELMGTITPPDERGYSIIV